MSRTNEYYSKRSHTNLGLNLKKLDDNEQSDPILSRHGSLILPNNHQQIATINNFNSQNHQGQPSSALDHLGSHRRSQAEQNNDGHQYYRRVSTHDQQEMNFRLQSQQNIITQNSYGDHFSNPNVVNVS